MNHQAIITHVLSKPGTRLRYPFDPDLPILFVGDKMFAVLGTTSGVQSVTLKADPDTVWLTRETYPGTVLPGYHMNKKHWNTVVLNGLLPETELLDMLEESYQLVRRKLTRAMKEEFGLS
ncbi:MmcQ/YjbR family DNA-binding protein [Paenibacillus filicis]|uniref:MmcQ/YjbR family DNA-binding protein n=1 Tax=Paenibacillus filicis TaxID=669464 RepID=A0ABU9DU03_9BACL